jgi:hypothetical protein
VLSQHAALRRPPRPLRQRALFRRIQEPSQGMLIVFRPLRLAFIEPPPTFPLTVGLERIRPSPDLL